ncbi:hypothetical protein [Methylopila sp. M107]|uniref:hypothetical protein n=1 Tax=Methylopila sp. M107 TaxID=1101190 RepID=UPI000381E643|nr:hypothetical protein [Methylopila sp. M107]
MSPSTLDPKEPHEADLLAPWRVVDRLDAEDAVALDRLLAEDPSLARRLDIAAEERDETVAFNETLPTPSRASLDRLFQRIEAEEASRAPKTAGVIRWLSSKLSVASPQLLAWGATAAALVIVVQAGLLTSAFLGGGETTYQTASDSSTEPPPMSAPAPAPAAPDGAMRSAAKPPLAQRRLTATAVVAFQPTATAEQITAALTEAKVEIVGGPKPGGVFVVRLLEGKLEDVVKRLSGQSAVVKFAAPGEQ